MSSDLAVQEKSLLYPSGERNHHHHHLLSQQQHSAQPVKPPTSPPPVSQGQATGATGPAPAAAAVSKNPLDDEPTSADEEADDVPPSYYSQAAAARLQKLREHERMAESSTREDGEEQEDDDEQLEERDQHQHQQQQQQYSSLMEHHQQRLLHQQQHLLAGMPMSSGGSIDAAVAAVKAEAASNGSEDKEPMGGGASGMDFCPVGGGIGDYNGGGDGSHRDSLSTVVRTRRRKAGLSDDERICAVCGDPASGYNFDRLTCESCKAFFRRNALKAREKIKPCSRGGGCDVSGSQRKHCPSCRLEKCLQVGMKKELILPPEKLEQRAKPKKRIKNGGGSGGPPSADATADSIGAPSSASAAAPAAPSQPKRSSHHHHHRSHHHQNQHQQQQQLQQHPSNGSVDLDPPLLGGGHHQQHQQQSQAAQLYSPLQQRHHHHHQLSPGGAGASSPPIEEETAVVTRPLGELAQAWASGTAAGRCWTRELTPTDRECLSSLEEALCRVRETLVSEEAGLGLAKDGIGRLEQAFNQMDACIRRIISVVKLIPIFSDVEKDSQILMLKVNIYGLVILYSSFFFNPATGAWEMPIAQHSSGSRSISLMQELAGSVAAIIEMRPDVSELTLADLEQYKANTENVYNQLERFSRRDDLVKMLMLALKLFNSDTMPAAVRGPIDEAQSVYSQLLKKYLACKFGVSEAMQMYPRLLMTFIDMRTVENKMTEFTKLLSVESLNPLVREVTQVN